MDKKRIYLLKEVFSKVKKDPLTGKYTIYKEDYLSLKLDQEMLELLENISQEYHIHLEKLPDSLTTKETKELFIKYNYLKSYIEKHPNSKNIQQLQEEMIQIKQTIVLGHMKLMYLFLSSRIPNLIKEQDNEDIYQTGYEFILSAIDKYDINKGVPFYKYLEKILTNNLFEIIWKEKRNLKINQARDIMSILPNIDKINEEDIANLDIDEIIKQTGLSKSRVEYLLLIILNTNEVSDKELPEHYFSEESFEEDLLNQIERENLQILIETLPEPQKQVIKLYYGFVDGKRYNHEEICQKLGYNNEERIRQIKEKGLATLSLPMYRNAISSFSERTEIIEDRLSEIGKAYRDRRQAELEEQIVSTIPKEKLIELIEEFPPMYKNVLELYYGLIDGINYNPKEISKILGKKEDVIKERIKEAIKRVAIKMNKNQNIPYTHTLVEYYLKRKRR